MSRIDTNNLIWIHKPQRYILSEDKVILETEPFTDFSGGHQSAEAIQLSLPPMSVFCFTVRVDFDFCGQFDQCGIVVYEGKERKMICDVKHHNEAVDELECIVFHDRYGDKSLREIGTAITWMYFRVSYRGGNMRAQYSFNGRVYTDLRHFHVSMNSRPLAIGIFACSPFDSSFDCTFSELSLMQDRKGTEK